ncbi:MAG: chloride channel protein [Deltaproteobacteria bacterium]|nr:chloride channel protein [Deltaproteobacteria bacterium]
MFSMSRTGSQSSTPSKQHRFAGSTAFGSIELWLWSLSRTAAWDATLPRETKAHPLTPTSADSSQLLDRGGHLFMVGAAVFVGLAGALGAVLFRLMIRLVQGFAFEGADGLLAVFEEGFAAETNDPLEVAHGLAWYWRVAIPAGGGLIVGPLIYFFAREARGHGIPEVMKAVAIRGGVIRARIVGIKALASALSIGTGGSVGREGPIVQIGSAFGSTVGQWFRLNAAGVRTLVGCGAAAGISATFNAPIAGAIFAAEIIVGDFAVTQFTPIVISSVVASVVTRYAIGNHPAFLVPDYEIVSPFELMPYMVAGVVAGIVAVTFIRTLSFSEDLFEQVPMPEWSRAALGGALVGVIAIWLPNIYGVGYTTISGALSGSLPTALMAALVIAKILATSITIGSGGSGGIFAPSLFLGAMSGGVVGALVENYFPGATGSSGAYALVTMGAVVAATTHAPVSAIIIIFELTQTIDIIPALMTACVISTLVSQLSFRDSIYTTKLRRQGIDIFETKNPNVLKDLYVRDVILPDPVVVPAAADFKTVLDLVVQSAHTQFYVASPTGQHLGAISLAELRRLIYEQETLQHVVVASDLVDSTLPSVTDEMDLSVVMQIFSTSHLDELAVVDADDRTRLVGAVREKDVIEASNREQLRRDLAGGFETGIAAAGRGQTVDLGDGYQLRETLALPHVTGRSLAELQLRERLGIQVLLVRGRDADGTNRLRVPHGGDVLLEGDTVIVAGTREALDMLDALAAHPQTQDPR